MAERQTALDSEPKHERRPRAGSSARGDDGLDVCDPLSRWLVAQQPTAPAQELQRPAGVVASDLEFLMTELVRRAAWGGDRRKGAARIELGSGTLAGATLLVQADSFGVSVDLELPPGAAPELWRQRIAERLEQRGLSLRELHVH